MDWEAFYRADDSSAAAAERALDRRGQASSSGCPTGRARRWAVAV